VYWVAGRSGGRNKTRKARKHRETPIQHSGDLHVVAEDFVVRIPDRLQDQRLLPHPDRVSEVFIQQPAD
jgi:hypothetical protein